MATLTVGVGQQFSTISDAVNASSSEDTIDIQAGSYTNDFVQLADDLTPNAVDGSVVMDATAQPPDDNLYAYGADIDVEVIPNAARPIHSGGPDTFGFDTASQAPITSLTVTSSNQAATTITPHGVINASKDAWQVDAQFTFAFDGQQVYGVYTATASHAASQS